MKAVNLIPGEQRAGSGGALGRSGGAALIVLGLLPGLSGLAVTYGSAHRQISSQAGETASLKAQTSVIEARIGRLAPYTSFVTMANQRVQAVSELVQSRFDWSHSLDEVGRVLPAGASLTSLHGTVGASESGAPTPVAGATPTSSTPPGSTPVFTLAGCATSQSEVAETLQRLRLIDGASDVQLQSSAKSGSAGSGGTGGGCPSGDPTFSAQITFTGLPAATAPSTPDTSAVSSTATASGQTEQVSAASGGAPR